MRVVSLVPSLTEALVEFGLEPGEDLVGVTSFCVHPEDARRKARVVGGTKNPKLDRVVDLAPDLVVANFEENRLEDVRALERAGLRVHATRIRTVEEAEAELRTLASAVGAKQAGEHVATRIAGARRDLEGRTADADALPVFVPIWKEPWMGFNGDTFAHDVLRIAGARNVLAHEESRYPVTSPAEALRLGARVALLPSEPWKFTDADCSKLEAQGFASALTIDGEALTWYGSRTAAGLREVAEAVDRARARAERASGRVA